MLDVPPPPPSISGTLTDAAGDPVESVCAAAYLFVEGGGYQPASSGCSDVTGAYSVVLQEPGTYKLRILDDPGYVGEWFDDAATEESATEITVDEDGVTGIDAALEATGSISGFVTDEVTGEPLTSVSVTAIPAGTASTGYFYGYADLDGHYEIPGLAAGDYRLAFSPYEAGYVAEYYDDKYQLPDADLVTVTSGDTSDADAALGDAGSIEGTVTDGVAGLGFVTVQLFEFVDGDWETYNSGFTDEDGSYEFSGLHPGNYRVKFDGSGEGYSTEFYIDAETVQEADNVTVTAGGTATADAVLVEDDGPGGGVDGASLSGTLTAGGAPLAGATVRAYNDFFGPFWTVGATSTDANGDWTIAGLDPGTYKLEFAGAPGYATEFYDDQPTLEAADEIELTAEQARTGLDAGLEQESSLHGTVTNDAAAPLGGVSVRAYTYNESNDAWTIANSTVTDSDGEWTLGGLAANTYRVGFDGRSAGYEQEFYDDEADVESAVDIVLSAGQDSAADAVLGLGATISGLITDTAGDPIQNSCVLAYGDAGGPFDIPAISCSDVDGNYVLSGLAPGTYKLSFQGDDNHLAEYYDNQPTQATANGIVVARGAQVTGKNAVLATAARITGTVTEDVSGDALEGVYVAAQHVVDGDWEYAESDFTDEDGSYSLGGLVGDDYRVLFEPDDNVHLSEWYDDKPTRTAANNVTVPDETTVADIDAGLAVGGNIHGTVTDGTVGIGDVSVTVLEYLGGGGSRSVAFGETDSAGNYDIGGLQPGTYRLRFNGADAGAGYSTEFWDDVPDLQSADDIDVVLGDSLTRDAALVKLGSISGTVTGPNGVALDGVCVRAHFYDDDQEYWGYSRTGCSTNGAYTITGLPAETYRLEFIDSSGNHLGEWWNDVATLADATDVPVATSEDVTGKNAELAAAAHITGRVTSASGGAGLYAFITAYELLGDEWTEVASTSTSSNGNYSLGGLEGGTYKLEFGTGFGGGFGGEYLAEWYDNQPDVDTATPVTVAPGATAAGKDAALERGGTISGTVTDPAGRAAQYAGVEVYRLGANGYAYYRYGNTDNHGDFAIAGLPTGTYKIHYYRAPYADEYWDDQRTLAQATPIDVVAGLTYADKDAQLELAASIGGRVTDSSGANAAGVVVTAYQRSGDGWSGGDSSDTTGADGTFLIEGLREGEYTLGYAGANYLSEFWNDKPSLSTADAFPVARSATITGKDASLATAGHITGTVTAEGGGPLEDVYVQAYTFVDGEWSYVGVGDYSAADGSYDLGGLPTGDHRIRFSGSGNYAGEWYDNAPNVEDATSIPVTAGATTSGRNVALSLGSHVTGRVTGSAGSGLGDISVYAYVVDGDDVSYVGYDYTSNNGNYDIGRLPAGDYKLEFVDEDHANAYTSEWWDNKPSSSTANAFAVGSATTVTGKDAVLVPGAHITGKVTDPGGSALQYTEVIAYRLLDGEYEEERYDSTNATGDYDFAGLPPGTYKVGFFPDDDALDSEYYNDAASLGAATPIVVAESATVASINAQLDAAAPLPSVTAGTPTISGTSQVGMTLTANPNPGTWSPAGLEFTYQWLSNDVAVSGAQGATFTPTSSQQGTTIKVRVTGSKEGYTSAVATSAATAAVAPGATPAVVNTGSPSVSGTAKVGQTLTADPGTWTPTGVSFAYVWLADDVVIGGAVSTTYVPVAGDIGKVIKVRVTGSKADHTAATATSAGSAPVVSAATPAVSNNTPPSITGTPQVGQTLTAAPGTWTPSDVDLAFEWLANDAVVAGQNGSTLVLTSAHQGATIKVRVTGSKSGYSSAIVTSSGVGPVAAAPTPPTPAVSNTAAPTVSGAAKVGATLSASGGSWSPGDVSLAYQWLANGAPIAGATSTTYAVPAGDVGKQLSVRVTASKTGSTAATATSASTGAVAKGTLSVVKKPKLSGQAKVSKTLTVKAGTFAPAGAKVKYQWLVNGKKVSGAKGTKFAIKAALKGKTISVKVTVTLAGYDTLALETKGKKVS